MCEEQSKRKKEENFSKASKTGLLLLILPAAQWTQEERKRSLIKFHIVSMEKE